HDPAHLRLARGANLHPPRNCFVDGRRLAACWIVSDVQCACLGLWHCGCNDHGRGRVACFCRYLEKMAVASLASFAPYCPICDCRRGLLLCESPQAVRRSLGAAIVWGDHGIADSHVATGDRDTWWQDAAH